MNLLEKSLLEITAQCISIRLGLVLRLGFGYSGLQSSLPEPAQNLRIARQNVSYPAIYSTYLTQRQRVADDADRRCHLVSRLEYMPRRGIRVPERRDSLGGTSPK